MLEKFISIKNIGRFSDYSASGDVTLRNLTLLFAENGIGKTTLCAILRSLQSGNSGHILERKTLGTNNSSQSPTVDILVDGSKISFASDKWSSIYPNIAIFDSTFIHDNVYAGDYVDLEHKKNLYRLIVGSQGVKLTEQIVKLDENIRKTSSDINAKKVNISLPDGIKFEDYLALAPIVDIDNKIKQKKTEIEKLKYTIEKTSEIKVKNLLSKIELPSFPNQCLEIFKKNVENAMDDAEVLVKEQITIHNMGVNGETWLSQGLSFITENNKCPFCAQEISANELIKAYRSNFNNAYKELKEEVANLSSLITKAIGESMLIQKQRTLSDNLLLLEFWDHFIKKTLPDFSFDVVRDKYIKLLNLALDLASKKLLSPTVSIKIDPDFKAALYEIRELQKCADSYNSSIDEYNKLIDEQKKAVQQGMDIKTKNDELAKLEINKKRFESSAIQACKEYNDALTSKVKLEKEKDSYKQQLDKHCETVIKKYEDSINAYLNKFNAGFQIANSGRSYKGGTPSSHYQIKINNIRVNLGDYNTSSEPCFKTTLSSGDRTALALAFFLSALELDTEIKKKIIVFDDPFTSLDSFRRQRTKECICEFVGKSNQVIVLSHDAYFLKLLMDGHNSSDIKVLRLSNGTNNSTVFCEFNIEEETQSNYMKYYQILTQFDDTSIGDKRTVAQTIRPFLEDMLRRRFPGSFLPNEWLGDFIKKIRNAATNDNLSHAQQFIQDIININEYSKKFHHGQNLNADSESIPIVELKSYVRQTLELIGK